MHMPQDEDETACLLIVPITSGFIKAISVYLPEG